MLKLRLKRAGKKRQPSYLIVLMDNKMKRDGYAIAELGFYNPVTKRFKINPSRILGYLKQGAQPSETLKNLLLKLKLIQKEVKNGT
jgi:small subunit ribosomal protein S16